MKKRERKEKREKEGRKEWFKVCSEGCKTRVIAVRGMSIIFYPYLLGSVSNGSVSASSSMPAPLLLLLWMGNANSPVTTNNTPLLSDSWCDKGEGGGVG